MAVASSMRLEVGRREYIGLAILLLVLIGGWFLFQGIFEAAFEAANFATYLVAVFSLAVSTYAALLSLHLKEAEFRRARDGAIGIVCADTAEIVQQLSCFSKRAQTIDCIETWNSLVSELEVIGERVRGKQARLALLASNLGVQAIQNTQALYLEMQLALMRVERFRLQIGQSSGKADNLKRLDTCKRNLIDLLSKSESRICEEYVGLQALLPDLGEVDQAKAT